jgi:hypothetical protein
MRIKLVEATPMQIKSTGKIVMIPPGEYEVEDSKLSWFGTKIVQLIIEQPYIEERVLAAWVTEGKIKIIEK